MAAARTAEGDRRCTSRGDQDRRECSRARYRSRGFGNSCRELERLRRQRRSRRCGLTDRQSRRLRARLRPDLACRQTAARQKPVVVSLGDVAASGGYTSPPLEPPSLPSRRRSPDRSASSPAKRPCTVCTDLLGVSKDIVSRGERCDSFRLSALGPASATGWKPRHAPSTTTSSPRSPKAGGSTWQLSPRGCRGRVWTGKRRSSGASSISSAARRCRRRGQDPRRDRRDTPVPLVRLPRPRRHWGLSLLQRLPIGARPRRSPWLAVASRERVWALLPFELRFF